MTPIPDLFRRARLVGAVTTALLVCAGCAVHHYHEPPPPQPRPEAPPPGERAEPPPPTGEPAERAPAEPQPAPAPRPPPPAAEPPAASPPPPRGEPASPPPSRRAPPPPPQGRLEATLLPAKDSFLPGESIPVRVVLTNSGRGTATVYEMRRAFMSFSVVDESGRVVSCHREDADHPRRIEPGRFVRIPPGGRLDHSVHLNRFCGDLEPGTWRARLSYLLPPAFDGSAFGFSATTGTFEAETSIRVEAPAPRANLALHISRQRRTRADEPFELTVRLDNRGPDAGLVLPPSPAVLDIEVLDARRRRVHCRLPASERMRRGDFVSLDRGRRLETTIDLAEHCRIDEGDYEVFARYAIEEAHMRMLPSADRVKVPAEPLISNRLPFERDAARPRVSVRLEAGLPATVAAGDEPIPVVVRAVNEGPDLAVLPVPGVHLVSAHVERESGGRARCSQPARSRRAPDPLRSTRRVRPGAAVVGQIDLRELCELDRPDRYEVTLTYSVPEGTGGVSWTGSAEAEPVLVTISPERRGRPVRAPEPERYSPQRPERRGHADEPEPEPPRGDRRRDREPSVEIVGPDRARAGRPIELTVRLTAGVEQVVLGKLAPWMITWTVQDRYGRRLSCSTPRGPRGAPAPSDFVTLGRRRSISVERDIAEACGIEDAGRYFVTAQVQIPRSWDGRRSGLEAWTGTLVSQPLTLEVSERRGRR